MRRALITCALAATAGLIVPTHAVAQPLPPAPVIPDLAQITSALPFQVPADLSIETLTNLLANQVANPEEIEALASLAPAIIGAAAGPSDIADDGKNDLLAQAKELLENSELPESIKSTLQRVITFLDGSGGGGPDIPDPNSVVITQFLYPTLGEGCISDTADSVGTALAVAGPSKLPPPGPGAGQTGFVFTALGTAPLAEKQESPLTVSWINVSNGRTGSQPLTGEAKINPDGPATLSAIADTGSGNVVAVISGGITTQKPDAEPRSCSFLPTIGLVTVR
ncbi:Rv1157c family protein [Rhodococcus sp. NPDC003382]|uniref:Rv1157c family protein n=1 Tax=Rhodococcus sp. HM1 TaxID=2937759 RepID=UPI00200B7720|nr:hypothetical protein [Rhodococcus sp. HM1]MCK8671222.1 hypothetical protein [Rhodococcus sp. HM1]